MKIGQKLWSDQTGWKDIRTVEFPAPPQLVLVFGSRQLMENVSYFDQIHDMYPDSHILSCSTSGEILNENVYDESIVLTAVLFEQSELYFAQVDIQTPEESQAIGKKLADSLPKRNLTHVMVFSDGLRVNGSALAKGLNDHLPSNVSVTGGLVGDGARFQKTVVGLDHVAETGKVVLIGYFGSKLHVGYGSFGGWDTFGIERMITRSKNNVLYELDGKPALELYKLYLGDKANGLPGTGLLFPLRLHVDHDCDTEVVRTILGVNESEQSMTFAGDMPEGATVVLMKANLERLIDGAERAGNMSKKLLENIPPDLAILISCVGRKLVLKERTDEEVQAVRASIGDAAALIGFYSYGELCPVVNTVNRCLLHNQTMTITTFRED